MSDRRHPTAVCHVDEMGRVAFTRAAEARGLEVVVNEANAAQLLQALQLRPVDVVLIDQHLPGTAGSEIIAELREGPDAPEVILTTSDLAITDEAMEAGAWGVASREDLEELDALLEEIVYFFETGNRRKGADRRQSADRRTQQDWSKVTSERRSGEDRRDEDRRGDR